MEVGKVVTSKKMGGPFFFSFLLFTFENDGNLFWLYQNGNFLPGKRHFTPGKKSGKMTLAPQKMSVTPLPWPCYSANGHCTASQYSAIPKHRVLLTRTNQKIHHNFSVFEYMKIAQNYAEVPLPSPIPAVSY